MKMGFINYCRPVFGLDGCFLKHACGGQLLCAVGRDGNNQMWPIAWAIVEGETRSSWEWFIRILSDDLNMKDGEGWTVISDQQKGLVPAIHEVWPQVEHRQCARHIYSNWRKAHGGRLLQKQFWHCVKATAMTDFAREVAKLKEYSEKAYEDFMARDPHTFCKSHFKCHSQCDSVDNNMAETFNSFILLARYKPIISMLEDIRLALMDRMQEKKKLLRNFVGGIAPRIHKKLKLAYAEQMHCKPHWNGKDDEEGFEVIHRGVSHAVHLGKRTCSCKLWDLSGIICVHAMSDILLMRKTPEDYISHWYKSETYKQCYECLLNPVQGSTFWDAEGEGSVLAPSITRRKMGRPKTARRRDPSEGPKNPFKASRQGVSLRCSHCGSTEHTRRRCPTAPPREQTAQEAQSIGAEDLTSQIRKKGRPRGSKNRIGVSIEDIPPNNATNPATILREKRRKSAYARNEGGRGGGSSGGRGAGRGRGRGRASQLRIPEGYGLWQGEDGQMAFRAPSDSQPTVIQLSSNIPSQTSDI